MKSKYRFLAVSDIHGNVDAVKKLIQTIQGRKYDGIFVAGDITNVLLTGNLTQAKENLEKIMQLLTSLKIPVYYVFGNRDFLPTKNGLQPLHLPDEYENAFFLGCQKRYEIVTDFYLTNKDTEIDANTIFLTHSIQNRNPDWLLQIAGHVHWGAFYKNYLNLGFLYRDEVHGATKILGCYWDIELSKDGAINAQWRNLGGMKRLRCLEHNFTDFYVPKNWNHCPICYTPNNLNTEIFREEIRSHIFARAELESVPLIGGRRAETLANLGITTINELAQVDTQILMQSKEIRKTKDKSFVNLIPMIKNYVKAIVFEKPIITGRAPDLLVKNSENTYFFDLEYDPAAISSSESIGISIIGIMNLEGKVIQYFSETPSEEKKMLEKFDFWLQQTKPLFVTYSSKSADAPMLQKANTAYSIRNDGFRELSTLDLFYDIIFTQVPNKQKIYLPMREFFGLKEISKYFGYEPPPDLRIHDGMQGLVEFKQYLKHKQKEIKDQLLLYNKSDLERTAQVYYGLRRLFLEGGREK